MFMNEEINIAKLSILSKAIYKFNALSIKIPKSFFTETEKNLKICMSHKIFQIAKAILRKNDTESIILTDLTPYSQAIIVRTAWYWHKNRHIDQWNRIKCLEISPCIHEQLTFDKGAKNTQWGGKTGYSPAEE